MYSKLPNLILAFHGCDKRTFDGVIHRGRAMKPSTNDYDWLGHGIYFWEQNLERAEAWAREQKRQGRIKTPAVIGAVIDLGHCLNLMDSEFIDLLKFEYMILEIDSILSDVPLPSNAGRTEDKLLRKLDCRVIEHLHERIESEYAKREDALPPFDSVRGLFAEGNPIYPGAGFKEKTHIQICVRNPNCIKGFFDPRKPSSKWPIP